MGPRLLFFDSRLIARSVGDAETDMYWENISHTHKVRLYLHFFTFLIRLDKRSPVLCVGRFNRVAMDVVVLIGRNTIISTSENDNQMPRCVDTSLM